MYSFIIRLHVIIFSESDIEWKDVTDRDILEKENINKLLPCIFHICCNQNNKVSKMNGFWDLRQKFPLTLASAALSVGYESHSTAEVIQRQAPYISSLI